jgi:hypothetical protein
MTTRSLAAALAASLALAAGCGAMPGSTTSREVPDPERFLPGLPLPQGSKVDLEKTLILGGAPDWTGRVAGEAPLAEDALIQHFREQLGKAGWKLVTISRSKNSLLTFTNAARAATIEVAPAGGIGGGSAFTVVVSPQVPAAAAQPGR